MIQGFNQIDNNRPGAPTNGGTVAQPSAAAARAGGAQGGGGQASATQDVSTVQGDGPDLGWTNSFASSFGDDSAAQGLQKTRHHNHVPYPGWPNPPKVNPPKPPVFDHTPKIDHSK